LKPFDDREPEQPTKEELDWWSFKGYVVLKLHGLWTRIVRWRLRGNRPPALSDHEDANA
jgi:hypothetical protein